VVGQERESGSRGQSVWIGRRREDGSRQAWIER
jgi:hypothetical protein